MEVVSISLFCNTVQLSELDKSLVGSEICSLVQSLNTTYEILEFYDSRSVPVRRGTGLGNEALLKGFPTHLFAIQTDGIRMVEDGGSYR